MATDKGKGVVGAAQNAVRQTTGALKERARGTRPTPTFTITTPTARPATAWTPRTCGKGPASPCEECKRLNNAGGPVGNVTGL